MITVTVGRPDKALDAHWEALSPFAHNAFMDPAALRAAGEALFAAVYVLLAWELSTEPARLVGMWALQAKHLLFWPFLEALPFRYASLSTPVLHPDYAEEVVPAFLAAIAANRTLPDTLVLKDLDAEGREFSALQIAAAAHPRVELRTDQRPIATRVAGIKRTGSTRRKLKQDWNRLAGEGALAVANISDPQAIAPAFEAFLAMEANGWKGGKGTALLSLTGHADFGRRLVAGLAAAGNASVALLTLDGRPVAAQVLLYCGKTAYTWKTSYDPAFARYSPGTLLVDRIATDLLDSGTAEVIDSCSLGEGFMAQLWTARKPMVDLVICARPARTLSFRVVSGYLRLREELKRLRKRVRTQTPRPAVTQPAKPAAEAFPAGRETPAPVTTADRAA